MIQLNRRERYAVYAAVGFIAIFLIAQFAAFPLIDKRERLQRGVQVKSRALQEMQILKAEYNALTEKSEYSRKLIQQKEKGFTLFSFLDQLAGKAKIKENITYMKPSTSTPKESPYKIDRVEMKVRAITLEKLTRYLHMVETSKNRVDVRRISLTRTGKGKKSLDAVLEIETLSL